MKTLFALILIVVLAAGAYWYFSNDHQKGEVRQAESAAVDRARQMGDTVKDKLKDFSLSGPEIKQELERTGKVVRKTAKEVGTVLADATIDARATATIKAKLVKEPDLSSFRISVNTTDGVVTLSGSVGSPEQVGQAMKVALETDGVREVISTLQVTTMK